VVGQAVLSSPRGRRRLVALLLVAAFAAVVALLIAYDRNSATPIATPVTKGNPSLPGPAPKSVKFSRAEAAQIFPVAQQFVLEAVNRRNMHAAWDITAPALRAGTARQDWDRGENTVIAPFPVDHAKWQLDYNYRSTVGLEVAVYPRKHASIQNPMVYYMELRRARGGAHRWLVDQWVPAPGSAQVVQGSASPSAGDTSLPAPTGLSTVWLALPAALLGMILVIPLTLGVREWRRGRRARRKYEAGLPPLPGSRPS
jgi:hypothetical protein